MNQITLEEWCQANNIGKIHTEIKEKAVDQRCLDCLYWRNEACRSYITDWPKELRTKDDGSCRSWAIRDFKDKKKYERKKRWQR